MRKTKAVRKEGFTLIEVALAILVVAIGMVAVFGLFPEGLKLNRNGIEERQMAEFASETFNAYRTLSYLGDIDNDEPADYPDAIYTGSDKNIPLFARVTTPGTPELVEFKSMVTIDGVNREIVDMAYWYEFLIEAVGRRREMTLYLWPYRNETTKTPDYETATIFYSELYDYKM